MAPTVALITCWCRPYYQSPPARRRLRHGKNPVIKYYPLAADFPAFSTKAKEVVCFWSGLWAAAAQRGRRSLSGGFKRPAEVSAPKIRHADKLRVVRWQRGSGVEPPPRSGCVQKLVLSCRGSAFRMNICSKAGGGI